MNTSTPQHATSLRPNRVPEDRSALTTAAPDFGALVISLDFELMWGVRDKYPPDGGAYRENLLGARRAVPRMLDVFARYSVSATWATVGCLFAESRDELREHYPAVLPTYENFRLFPYDEPLGEGERDDPLHFAPGLVRAIRDSPDQELATHTFSHYYCLEPGQSRAAFRADLSSAGSIARKHGVTFRSIVFPRNQFNPDYVDDLRGAGIVAYRSNENGWLYDYRHPRYGGGALQRTFRKADAYLNLSGSNLTPWDRVPSDGLCKIPSSRFLRPYSRRTAGLDGLRLKRIAADLRAAASRKSLYHVWWHPHNFGRDLEANLRFLCRVLDVFAESRDRFGMRSLSMSGVAEVSGRA